MKRALLFIPRLAQVIACVAVILVAEPLLLMLDNNEDKP